jgi:hypothetical protein
MPLLCDRPHPDHVNYETSRFVVSDEYGISLGHTRLVRGDEVPRGALTARELWLEYQAFHIETCEFAAKDDDLREACARRGVDLGTGEAHAPVEEQKSSQPIRQQLEQLTRSQLAKLCEQNGLDAEGTKQELRDRILAIVV